MRLAPCAGVRMDITRFACIAFVALTGCASAPHKNSLVPSSTKKAASRAPAKSQSRSSDAHAVLALGGRAFVLFGERPRNAEATPAERVVVAGGWALELTPIAETRPAAFTLV